MDITNIMQAISTVGFPIAMCLILMWYIKSNDDNHKEEMDKITDALNNNTIALTKLASKLDIADE